MFPPNIRQFVKDLIAETKSDRLQWTYDDDSTTVSTRGREFSASLRYWFNANAELSEFFLAYTPPGSFKEFRFSTEHGESDYDIAKYLYDLAQASDLDFPDFSAR
jgi:hypothetical protein